jgi:gluconate 5-dehydrogenase
MDTLSLFSLKGSTALITGSGSGIGLAIAEGFASAGAKIILNGRNRNKLNDAAAKLASKGYEVSQLAFDVVDSAAAEGSISDYEDNYGPINILVNNAGISIRRPFLEFEEADWKKVLDVNINGAMIMSQAVGKYMIKRKAGKIINICSVQSELGRPAIVPYTVSKGGLKMLTKALCSEWARYNIQVNAIGPGYFETELTKPLKENPEFDKWLCSRTPANRWGQVNELTGAAVFLASKAADYVNGHILYVDGGLISSV